ncbi:POK8 protein, partial [Pelecanoides urinatrix]|nr:POK8 protein [Pelecanoides urinatrix]
DIKDCFFSIPLHPGDRERFAFSIPERNHQAPTQRYQWKVLPQGMKNSPTLCQIAVGKALQSLRRGYPGATIIHYMDDILLSHQDESVLQRLYDQTV